MARLHTQFLKTSGPVSSIGQDIDQYITAHDDGNFDEVLAADGRWEVFFHLSDMRVGLLSWYDMPRGAEVLEIGCGFGALTGMLAERSAHLTAVTDSLLCAQSCAKRWQALENLDVYAGLLSDLPFHQQFDVITLVDVLPFAAGGARSLAPYAAYLKSLLRYLKPQGRLLLAMDNRLGIKYACGACDPYSDEPFGELSGIVGQGRLFTRVELTKLLSAAGIPHWKFYYPLPDYRLPQFIFSDASFPDAAVFDQLIPYDPTPDTRVLSESALYADLLRNGLFPQMANSFLVECGMQADLGPTESVSLAFDRIPAYRIATCREGSHFVKKPMTAAALEGLRETAANTESLQQRGLNVIPCELKDGRLSMPYLNAPTMASWLKAAAPKDRDAVLAAMERLWAAILQSSPPAANEENAMKPLSPRAEWGVILRRVYLNMTPDNLFFQDGTLTFFNQGLCHENLPAKYQMFLAIYENLEEFRRLGVLDELKDRYEINALWDTLKAAQKETSSRFYRYDVYRRFYEWADMDPLQMLKNRQILKIVGSEDGES